MQAQSTSSIQVARPRLTPSDADLIRDVRALADRIAKAFGEQYPGDPSDGYVRAHAEVLEGAAFDLLNVLTNHADDPEAARVLHDRPRGDKPEEAGNDQSTVTTHDFGAGPVPAHQHPNGGGWVADTAHVDESAYVGPNARVFGSARVSGYARMSGNASISEGEYR